MHRLVKFMLLVLVIAGAGMAILYVTDVIDAEQFRDVALKTLAVIGIVFVAAAVVRAFSGASDTRDRTDKPVP